MASEAAANAIVNGSNPRILDWLFQLLEPHEREAVRGDFAELGTPSHEALWQLLGLIVRRQVQAWAHWRPWFAFFGVVIPLGFLLSIVSRYWSASTSIYSWLYVNNWTQAYIGSPGARADLAQTVGSVCLWCAALALWSWTTGFAVASISRRTIRVHGTLFCLVLFGGTLGSATAGAMNPANAMVFAHGFYRVALPVIVKAVVVILPAAWGMRSGMRRMTLPLRAAIACAALVVALTVSTARAVEGAVIFGWMSSSVATPVVSDLLKWRGTWQMNLLPLLLIWPAVVLVILATLPHRRGELRQP